MKYSNRNLVTLIITLICLIFLIGLVVSGNIPLRFMNKQSGSEYTSSQATKEPVFQTVSTSVMVNKTPYSGKGMDYRHGNDDAKVRMFVFSDFECNVCAQMKDMTHKIIEAYGDKILVVFKNYPLDSSCNHNLSGSMHQNACLLARYARCMGDKGKFWEFHDRIYDNNSKLSQDLIVTTIKQLKEDPVQIEQCSKSEAIDMKIKDDVSVADKVGVTATPSVLINNKLFTGLRSFDVYASAIDTELAR